MCVVVSPVLEVRRVTDLVPAGHVRDDIAPELAIATSSVNGPDSGTRALVVISDDEVAVHAAACVICSYCMSRVPMNSP